MSVQAGATANAKLYELVHEVVSVARICSLHLSVEINQSDSDTFFGLLHLHYCTKQLDHVGVCYMGKGAQVYCWLHRALFLSEPAYTYLQSAL